MTRKTLILGAFVLSIASGAPAFAQMNNGGMMAANPGTKMSKSQMASMNKCKAMTSTMMKKNKKCMSMAKMHPEMMPSGNM